MENVTLENRGFVIIRHLSLPLGVSIPSHQSDGFIKRQASRLPVTGLRQLPATTTFMLTISRQEQHRIH